MMQILDSISLYALLIFGFGFVVFFHELGHFLAAKWVGIKVEQFAVGFGHAILSWRKGLGLRIGSSAKKVAALKAAGQDVSGISETEYRFNWIPLGGYVKMLGQDDMDPNATSEDPRSFNRKSIKARMLVVSAGVVMNVILAAILFMLLFMGGYHVPTPVVGSMQTNSPAQVAGLQVGDRIRQFNGNELYAFTQLYLETALTKRGEPAKLKVERDGKEMALEVYPRKGGAALGGFYALGIGGIRQLEGMPFKGDKSEYEKIRKDYDPKTEILPGDTILAVNGKAVTAGDYPVLDQAIQNSGGKPVELRVRDFEGQERTVTAVITFAEFFGDAPIHIAGMQPQPGVRHITDESPVKGKLQDGDVITSIRVNGHTIANPSFDQLLKNIFEAGKTEMRVDFVVERDGKRQTIQGAIPSVRVGQGKWGMSMELELNAQKPVVTRTVENSPADRAGIPSGALIQKVNGTDVRTWFDVHGLLKQASGPVTVSYVVLDAEGNPRGDQPGMARLEMTDDDKALLDRVIYSSRMARFLKERIFVRQTSNPIEAAGWGVRETRDLLLQFYVTLARVSSGDVSPKNFMGPLGIVSSGSKFASMGWDWLVWFLAMISANLAVVNFLPIPIVDGGLFLFLILEKIMGRPLSPRMQTVAQLVGLAFLVSVFLLVTYQDIARMFL